MPDSHNDSQPDTIQSLLDLMTHVEKAEGKPWWRGVKDGSKYKLVPGIFREEENSQQEANKIRLFQEMAHVRYDKCPSGKLDDLETHLEWLFLMQHHRLQTRLLDWTKSPLLAAFFAVSNNTDQEKDCDGAIWYLLPRELNKAHFPELHATAGEFLSNSKLIRKLYSDVQCVAAIMPRQIDTRMLLQMSRFTLHGDLMPLEDYPNQEKYLHKIIVPAGKKGKIANQLAYMGITASNFFPDLDHLASDLNQNIFEAF